MSFVGYADFDRPLNLASGQLFYPFGSGAFGLAPLGCRVAVADDGQLDFRLDLLRSLSGKSEERAILELQLTADYAADEALAELRGGHPNSVLTRSTLTNWSFRLLPGARSSDLLREFTLPNPLASSDFGSARLIIPMSIESGWFMESLLSEQGAPLDAVAEADLLGVSPRVQAVVRFTSGALLPPLLALADATGALTRRAVVGFFAGDRAHLPLELSGDVESGRELAFAEAMADRIIARFGSYATSSAPLFEPVVVLDRPNGDGDVDLRWSLSQPFLASRRMVLPLDLLSEVRRKAREVGVAAFVHRETLTALPALGRSHVTAYCNLPADRRGVEALGVTLTFPPHLPARPQAIHHTILFEAPADTGRADLSLSPGEPLSYSYSTLAVIADQAGVRELHGPEQAHSGPTLRLSPADFPIDLCQVELTSALAQLASLNGICRYEVGDSRFSIPFTIDSGRLSVSVALPRERASTSILCTLAERSGSGSIELGPFETPQLRLDLTSLVAYGPQRVTIQCSFDDDTTLCGLDLLPFGSSELPSNITTLLLTPSDPSRSFSWYSASPFQCGFRYRLRGSDGSARAWRECQPSEHPLLLKSSDWQVALPPQREVTAASSRGALRETMRVDLSPRSEASAADAGANEATAPLPVSPQSNPTDELLFARADDPSKKLYLPRYELDVQLVSGQRHYRIAMSELSGKARLTVSLLVGPAESLRDSARDAEELPHKIEIHLQFLAAPPAGLLKTLAFDDIGRSGNVVTASLTFSSLQERDEVFLALTEPARTTKLLVQRFFDVSVPTPRRMFLPPIRVLLPRVPPSRALVDFEPRPLVVRQPAVDPVPLPFVALAPALSAPTAARSLALKREAVAVRAAGVAKLSSAAVALRPAFARLPPDVFVLDLPLPELAFLGIEAGPKFNKLKIGLKNWAAYPDELFLPSPDLPPCGAVANAARTWLEVYDAESGARLYEFGVIASQKQLSELEFALAVDIPVPKKLSVTLLDRRTKTARNSAAVETRSVQRVTPPLRDTHQQLDHSVAPEPFVFSTTLHPYIFQGIAPASGGGQLVRYRLRYKGATHTYFQDAARPERVYFLPDCLKIARRREAPFTPLITVRVSPRGDSDEAQVVFDYVVAPYTSPKRLDDAQAQLLADPHSGAQSVHFEPFVTSDVRFYIDRPTQQGAVREQRADASRVLEEGLRDSLTLTLPDFQLLFDAMNRDTATLFSGRIEVDIPNEDKEQVPFVARMSDMEGELFSYEAVAGSDGNVVVTLHNGIESPIQINTLDLSVSQGATRCKGVIVGSVLPIAVLGPSESAVLTVRPLTTLSDTNALQLSFDLDGVVVKPDAEAIWNSILDRSTLEYFMTVVVKANLSLFDPIPDREQDRIVSVLIEFEGGGTAQLSSGRLESSVRVDFAIDDVILRRPIDESYRYNVTVVRADGRQERDPTAHQQTAPVFWVTVNK